MATLLHITNAGLGAWHSSTSAGQGRWLPGADPASRAVWIVTDLAEEVFADVTVPRIFGADRQRYIARQLANRFPDNPFCMALRGAARGSLMERLAPSTQTLAAIDPPDRLRDALAEVGAPVAGVWSSSLLMAHLARRAALPRDVFMVLCSAAGMRVVFVHNGVPVITRLLPDALDASTQSAEILRTVRHLENTRTIERNDTRYGIVLLGAALGVDAALQADRLDALPVPATWRKRAARARGDWVHFLFDVARQSPQPQLAPLALRARYVAQQITVGMRWVLGAAALGVATFAWLQLTSLWVDQQSQRAAEQTSRDISTALAQAEAGIAQFGVTPQQLRDALALDAREIVSAPDLLAHMQQLAERIQGSASGTSTPPNPVYTLKTLQWRVLPSAEQPCASPGLASHSAAAPPADASAQTSATPQSNPAFTVELTVGAEFAATLLPTERAQALQTLSHQLAQWPGVRVLIDPAQALQTDELRREQGTASAKPAVWCLAWATPSPSANPTIGTANTATPAAGAP